MNDIYDASEENKTQMTISKKSKDMQEFFRGEKGNEYTERNEQSNSTQKNAADIIYNTVKMHKIKSVCEIGCNVGHNLSRLDNLTITCGIDINESALEKGREKYPFVNFIKGSIYDLPLYDNSFELVFTRGVLIHVAPVDRIRVLEEMKRVSSKFIINIEYPVRNSQNQYEAVQWREEKELWRFNAPKYWKQIENVDVRDYFEVDKEMDAEGNWICLARKF